MIGWRCCSASICMLLLGAAPGVAFAADSVTSPPVPPRIPVEAFAAGENFGSPSLSPNGEHVVFMTHVQGVRYVAVRNLADNTDRLLMRGEGGTDGRFAVRYCWFKSDRRILCHYAGFDYESGRPFALSRLVALNVDGTAGKVLVQNGRAGASQFQDRILHRLPNDPANVLIELDDDANIFPSVFELNVDTGKLVKVVRSREPIVRWSADRSGVVRFGYGFRGKKSQYITRDSADDPWRPLLKFERFGDRAFTPLGFGSLPDRMLVSAEHRGRDAIFELDLRDQQELELVFSHPQVDIDGAYQWPNDGQVAGFEFETERPQLHLLDPQMAGIQATVDAAIPGAVNRVISSSSDRNRLLIWSYSDTTSGTAYLLDIRMKALRALGLDNEMLRNATLATMRPVRVPGAPAAPDTKAADAGFGSGVMPGYLTLPVGRGEKKLPAVVMPHGGPYARDSWGNDDLVQLLANRGIAVLQLNYRGSTGFGSDWLDAGFQGWGTVMHDDITAGARWLIQQGIADPDRLCIVGWSYGGYAALIGAVKEPNLYRCAVSIAGVSDLKAIQAERDRFYGGRAATINATGTEDLDDQSPRRRASEIKAPVLLVHGEADINVVRDHSEKMASALRKAGKSQELLMIEEGDHSLIRPSMRAALYAKLDEFLGRHLGLK